MASLHGPYQISAQFQVKLPRRLARELRFEAGDQFHWRQSDEDPAVLLLIPEEVVERRYEEGRRRELSGSSDSDEESAAAATED